MSNLKMRNKIKRVNFYVFMKAIEKANCSHHVNILRAIELDKLSQSDKDTLNMMAFDSTEGCMIDLNSTPKLKDCTQEIINKEIEKVAATLDPFRYIC
ncbi:hypothetical protein [Halobacteriovorax sp. CON-3]|uniref:hypothetical protein n=1 Tax=Halobacteriovorax sp. CON-3 TaxID=3157710 RepID=UPI0037161A1E